MCGSEKNFCFLLTMEWREISRLKCIFTEFICYTWLMLIAFLSIISNRKIGWQTNYRAGAVSRERHQLDGSIEPATGQPVSDAYIRSVEASGFLYQYLQLTRALSIHCYRNTWDITHWIQRLPAHQVMLFTLTYTHQNSEECQFVPNKSNFIIVKP